MTTLNNRVLAFIISVATMDDNPGIFCLPSTPSHIPQVKMERPLAEVDVYWTIGIDPPGEEQSCTHINPPSTTSASMTLNLFPWNILFLVKNILLAT